MINFFKRIRQQLLSENKTGKYFKYALGQIIHVFIGIASPFLLTNLNDRNGLIVQKIRPFIMGIRLCVN